MKTFDSNKTIFSEIPSVDKLLNCLEIELLIANHGQPLVVKAIRELQNKYRFSIKNKKEKGFNKFSIELFIQNLKNKVINDTVNSIVPVINLTGIILHSNLGRALLPPSVINNTNDVLSNYSNLEFDLTKGRRNEREIHIEEKLCSLIGAEAVTVVNNNAAAVMLALNTLAKRKEVLVSRGELIEIGGSFRLPDIMKSANCKLKEVGTTNRTHLEDYINAMKPTVACLFKAYASNFSIKGYTKNVEEKKLINLCKENNIPFIIDLGSGALIDFKKIGLNFGPYPHEKIKRGVDLVTFSGDKLMGGPQCGIIAGRNDLIKRICKNPMKRALRCDKYTISALSELLKIYQNPSKATKEIPTLRFIYRTTEEIKSIAERVLPPVIKSLGNIAIVEIVKCNSQVGSGSLPNELLPSFGISIKNKSNKRDGLFPIKLSKALRELPTPIISRIKGGSVILDLRCLEKENLFVEQFNSLKIYNYF